jgi:hypothetical protein
MSTENSEPSEELLSIIVNTNYLKILENWTKSMKMGFTFDENDLGFKVSEEEQERKFEEFVGGVRGTLDNDLNTMFSCFNNPKFKSIEKLLSILGSKEMNMFVFRRQARER